MSLAQQHGGQVKPRLMGRLPSLAHLGGCLATDSQPPQYSHMTPFLAPEGNPTPSPSVLIIREQHAKDGL